MRKFCRTKPSNACTSTFCFPGFGRRHRDGCSPDSVRTRPRYGVHSHRGPLCTITEVRCAQSPRCVVHNHRGPLCTITEVRCAQSPRSVVHNHRGPLYTITEVRCAQSPRSVVHHHRGPLFTITEVRCAQSPRSVVHNHRGPLCTIRRTENAAPATTKGTKLKRISESEEYFHSSEILANRSPLCRNAAI